MTATDIVFAGFVIYSVRKIWLGSSSMTARFMMFLFLSFLISVWFF